MKKGIFFYWWLIFGIGIAQAQITAQFEMSDPRINQRRPSAFVTFEKYETRAATRQDEGQERIVLRFHNNSIWKVCLRAHGPYPDIGISDENRIWTLSYDVRRIAGYEQLIKDKDVPIGYQINHHPTIKTLLSGESVPFSVPQTVLRSGLSIFVRFSYEWEFLGKTGGDLSIIHEAPYSSIDLPSKENRSGSKMKRNNLPRTTNASMSRCAKHVGQ